MCVLLWFHILHTHFMVTHVKYAIFQKWHHTLYLRQNVRAKYNIIKTLVLSSIKYAFSGIIVIFYQNLHNQKSMYSFLFHFRFSISIYIYAYLYLCLFTSLQVWLCIKKIDTDALYCSWYYVLWSSGISQKSGALIVRYRHKNEWISLIFYCIENLSIAHNFETTGPIQVGLLG